MTDKKSDSTSRKKTDRGTKDSLVPAPSPSYTRTGAISPYDPLEAFLQEIQHYPLLDPDEEKALAEVYQETGDVKAAARLVTSNLRLVVKIAFEYRRAYRNIMDLIQEGNIGLMQAVKKFDPTRGVKLSSYAAWWIRAYILRFIVNNWRLVKLGTTQTQRKLFFNLNKEKARLLAASKEPTPALLAEQLGVSEEEVVDMERRLQGMDVSLNAEINDSDGKPLARIDLLVDESDLQDTLVHDARFEDLLHTKLTEFGRPLIDKEAYIFEHRLVSEEPLTLQEIGDHYGISRERVRQIEKRLMGKLRSHLQTELPDYFDQDLDA